MKSIELLALGVRLLGIYVLINGVRLFFNIQTAIQYNGTDDHTYLYVAALEVILVFGVALLMLKFPALLSRWLMPSSASSEIAFDGTSTVFETTLFVILGVYILSWAIPDLFANSLWWIYLSNSTDITQASRAEVVINFLVTLLECAIGLFLSIRANGLNALLRRLRTA